MLYLIAAIYGVLIGNYITTAYFRIPLSIPINGLGFHHGKLPHCSVCNHQLKFYEYFPVLSWIFCKFKCNYCNAVINPIYTVLEVSIMLFSVSLLWLFGMNIFYACSVLVVATLMLNIALYIFHHRFFSKAIYSFISTLIIGLLVWITA